MFNKVCKVCGKSYQSKSRNKQKCIECSERDESGVYKPHEKKESVSKFTCNYFKNDYEALSYFIGFCYADSYVHHSNDLIKVSSTDRCILEEFKRRMNYNGSIIEHSKPKYEHYKQCYTLPIYSNHARYFKQFGLINKKINLRLPQEGVDLKHFLRGLIDGDGSISLIKYKTKYSINHVSLVSEAYNLLCDIQGIFGGQLYQKKDNLYYLQWSSSIAERLLDYLYEGATIYLDRKYQKYLQVK